MLIEFIRIADLPFAIWLFIETQFQILEKVSCLMLPFFCKPPVPLGPFAPVPVPP
jgi:hypothetical protein